MIVTAPELARRLGRDPKALRKRLRELAAAGHPIFGGHVHRQRWEFSEPEARRLEAELRGNPAL